jgi:hypothetical protein
MSLPAVPDAVGPFVGEASYFHERRGIVSADLPDRNHRDHVCLAFIMGRFYPNRGCSGTQKYKRYLRLKSYDDAPCYLVADHCQFDPRAASLKRELK